MKAKLETTGRAWKNRLEAKSWTEESTAFGRERSSPTCTSKPRFSTTHEPAPRMRLRRARPEEETETSLEANARVRTSRLEAEAWIELQESSAHETRGRSSPSNPPPLTITIFSRIQEPAPRRLFRRARLNVETPSHVILKAKLEANARARASRLEAEAWIERSTLSGRRERIASFCTSNTPSSSLAIASFSATPEPTPRKLLRRAKGGSARLFQHGGSVSEGKCTSWGILSGIALL